MTPVEEHLRAEIERRGPIPFDEVVEAALYHPDAGFYATSGRAGRRGDFLTSPEVGPLFGAVVARALDAWWAEAGSPAVFTVVEAGAGPGTLATAVLAAGPCCSEALRYVLVERSAPQRAIQAERLALEEASAAFAGIAEPEGGGPDVVPPTGPIVVSLPELPGAPGPCIVLANELLDDLPFGLLERTAIGWSELHVGVDGDALVEVLVPTATEGWPAAPIGARVPCQTGASNWVWGALALAGPGSRIVAIDYASTTPELATRPWSEWLRTYRLHARGGPPLEALGSQDITCEVAVDQLPTPTSNRSQADWLRAHGIDELVAEGRQIWQERAPIGDLAAIRARSRVTEAEALCDESGLGAFRVLEWAP